MTRPTCGNCRYLWRRVVKNFGQEVTYECAHLPPGLEHRTPYVREDRPACREHTPITAPAGAGDDA